MQSVHFNAHRARNCLTPYHMPHATCNTAKTLPQMKQLQQSRRANNYKNEVICAANRRRTRKLLDFAQMEANLEVEAARGWMEGREGLHIVGHVASERRATPQQNINSNEIS